MNEHIQPSALRDFETLEGAARGTALTHLERCMPCRRTWLAHDPSRAFALLSRGTVPSERLDELSVRVAEAVSDVETAPAQRRMGFGAAAIAASVLLAAFVGAALWTHEIPQGTHARLDNIVPLEPLDDSVAGMRLVPRPGEQAQAFDLKIGETQVLMIFSESIEL